jgi:ketosteroid isomerase-like protein
MDAADLDPHRRRNLDAVLGAFAGIGAGDPERQLAHYTDDMVLDLPFSSPPKRIEGKAAALEFLSVALGAFELTLTVDEVHPGLDPDEMVIEFCSSGTHRASGAPYANRYVAVYRFRDGAISFQREYYDTSAVPGRVPD